MSYSGKLIWPRNTSVKYSGTTQQFIRDTYLRLQASLSYAGARNWTEFRKNTYPVMRSNAGIIAADTHLDVTIDKWGNFKWIILIKNIFKKLMNL